MKEFINVHGVGGYTTSFLKAHVMFLSHFHLYGNVFLSGKSGCHSNYESKLISADKRIRFVLE